MRRNKIQLKFQSFFLQNKPVRQVQWGGLCAVDLVGFCVWYITMLMQLSLRDSSLDSRTRRLASLHAPKVKTTFCVDKNTRDLCCFRYISNSYSHKLSAVGICCLVEVTQNKQNCNDHVKSFFKDQNIRSSGEWRHGNSGANFVMCKSTSAQSLQATEH